MRIIKRITGILLILIGLVLLVPLAEFLGIRLANVRPIATDPALWTFVETCTGIAVVLIIAGTLLARAGRKPASP